LATMVYEMIEGIPPFWDEQPKVMLEQISACNLNAKFDEKFSLECIGFITSILKLDSANRLGRGNHGTEDIKNHPWFSEIDWVKLYNKQLEPPFKPHLKDASDTRYFDTEVTSEDPNVPLVNKKFSQMTLQDDPFEDFSFEDPYLRASPSKSASRQDQIRTKGARRSTPVKIAKKRPTVPTKPRLLEILRVHAKSSQVLCSLIPKNSELKSPRGEAIKIAPRSPKKEVGKSPNDVTKLYHHKKLNSSPGGLITTDLRQPKLLRKPSAPVKLASTERVAQVSRNRSEEGRGHVRSKSGTDLRVTEENQDKCQIS